MTALRETIEAQGDLLERVLSMSLERPAAVLEPAQRLWLVGTGTSQHAAELGALMFGAGARHVRWASAAALRTRSRGSVTATPSS